MNSNHDQTLIYPGSEVKALGDGRVGGYLVRFSAGPEGADSQGDFFTSDTYFGRAVKAGVDVVYHHGLGRIDTTAVRLGNAVVGDGSIEVKADGLVIEASVADPEVYARAERGELGWSSGSVDRLVKREPVQGKTAVKSWPIIEASLSPRPVDPRNKAIAIKALMDDEDAEVKAVPDPAPVIVATTEQPEPTEQPPASGGTLVDRAEVQVSCNKAILGEFRQVADSHNRMNAKKREAIKALAESTATLSEGFRQLHDDTAPKPDPDRLAALRRKLILERIAAPNGTEQG